MKPVRFLGPSVWKLYVVTGEKERTRDFFFDVTYDFIHLSSDSHSSTIFIHALIFMIRPYNKSSLSWGMYMTLRKLKTPLKK